MSNGAARAFIWYYSSHARDRGKQSRGDALIRHLRSIRPSNKLTTDEIMALMRGKP